MLRAVMLGDMLNVIMLNIIRKTVTMLSAMLLSVIMPTVIKLSAVMLNVTSQVSLRQVS
jgi:hypothetical protein